MLNQSCETLPGVGPALALKLKKCGIVTVGDLLFHLPARYQDRTRITPIQDLRSHEYAVISGQVIKTQISYGKRMILNCHVEDKTGLITLKFFHFNKQQIKSMEDSPWIRAFGEVREFGGQMGMTHPEYHLTDTPDAVVMEETLTPIYPATEGLTQSSLRRLVKTALKSCQQILLQMEWMSENERNQLFFPSMEQALSLLHNPPPDVSLHTLEEGHYPPLKRMAFDELLAQRLSLDFARQHRNRLEAPVIPVETRLKEQFLSSLPFPLTAAQLRVSTEIAQDLTQKNPMLRLVQGDVGSGKTMVAALSILQAAAAGYQSALMAPTELLSDQHAANLEKYLSPLGIRCLRLTGKMKTKEKREVLAALKNHACDLIIGTHALFQDAVEFSRLGLVVIDEQHRFGVEQRLLLQQKALEKITPHQLLMTATPIPRTLAMTHWAHMDISVIDELPPGRVPVVTAVLNQDKREPVIERLKTALASGIQAYWICTLIEESEKMQNAAATLTAETLQAQLPMVRVGLVHGKMAATEKSSVMLAFKAGEIDLLVATTVIEVGVDVPNANLMVIENAERLGLAQLHQLRGRVGRGHQQAYCLLLYQAPLSSAGKERLKVMRESTDGFLIAEKDLQLRGAGEVLGTRQAGCRLMKIAHPERDKELLIKAAKMGRHLIEKMPETAKSITRRWLGDFEQFFQG